MADLAENEQTMKDDGGTLEETSTTTVNNDNHGVQIRDWANVIDFNPEQYFRPRSLDNLRAILQQIFNVGGDFRIRVLGGLHSCSEIVVSNCIIDVTGLPKDITWENDDSMVTASASFTFHEFLGELSEKNKSLQGSGGTDEQTMAGLMATNTAPATHKFGIYDLMEWIEFYAPDDKGSIVLRRLSRADGDFNAAIASLGCVGFITKFCTRVVDETYYHTVQHIVKLDDILKHIPETNEKYDFWRVDWIPESDKALMWNAKQIPPNPKYKNTDYKVDESETILQWVNKMKGHFSKGPFFDVTDKVVYNLLTTFYQNINVSGTMRHMIPVDRKAPIKVAMAEWSFDPNEVCKIKDLCRAYFKHTHWPNLPIEIELTKVDSYLMSPWNWEGLETDYIVKFNFMYLTDELDSKGKQQMFQHLKGLWDKFIEEGVRFKAHWGKINFMDPDFVASRYKLDEFQPYIVNRFVNDYLAVRGVGEA